VALPSEIFLLQAGHGEMDLFPGSLPSPFWSSHTPGRRLSWTRIGDTLRRMRKNPPLLAIVNYREEPFFRTGTGWASGLGSAAWSVLFRPSRLGELLFFAQLIRQRIPIALLNRSDIGEIPAASDWYYRRCHVCFVRELSPQPEMTLKSLFSTSGGNPQTNRRARRILGLMDPPCPPTRITTKLRPISLGLPDSGRLPAPSATKKHDIFFAGDLHEKGLRGRLVEECRRHAENRNWRLCLRERMGQEEFWKTLSESRLCLSPPGMGWDCWRHYEAMALGAVPLMPYPTILQDHPPVDGQHCFYFPPEPGGLSAVLDRAMDQGVNLTQMAEAGRQLTLAYHTWPKLRDYVIRETLRASAGLA